MARKINESDRSGRAITVDCDIRNRDDVEALVDACLQQVREPRHDSEQRRCVVQAGFNDNSPNGWETIVNIKLHGTYHCSQVAGAAMQEFGGGSIINFSSVAGIQPAAFIEPAPAPHRA